MNEVIETLKNEYVGNRRICTQRVVYRRSEDISQLANTQRSMEAVEEEMESEKNSVQKARLSERYREPVCELEERQSIVDGYAVAKDEK